MTGRDAARATMLLGAVAALAIASSCRSTATGGPEIPRVDHLGSITEMLESGSTEGKFALAPLLGLKHLYAIGPLDGMRGELLVWDGTSFVARVAGDTVAITTERDVKALFLVWSSVREWREVKVPDEARPLSAFEPWLGQAASRLGLPDDRPFAFRVVGAVERAELHVLDHAPGAPLTTASHEAAKKPFSVRQAPVQMLGFHSRNARGIYTPRDSNVHVHLRTTVGSTMGHVTDFTLAPGAIVEIAWK